MAVFSVDGPTIRVGFKDFQEDVQGRTFTDVTTKAPDALKEALAVLSKPAVQLRMTDAENHFGRPALAGAVVEIEACPAVRKLLEGPDKQFRDRFKRAVGVCVRMTMERMSWRKRGLKSAVGTGESFRIAERYSRP